MTSPTKLEPCPFCGAPGITAKITTAAKFTGSIVVCTGCETRTHLCADEGRAIAAWNRRPLPASVEGMGPVGWLWKKDLGDGAWEWEYSSHSPVVTVKPFNSQGGVVYQPLVEFPQAKAPPGHWPVTVPIAGRLAHTERDGE